MVRRSRLLTPARPSTGTAVSGKSMMAGVFGLLLGATLGCLVAEAFFWAFVPGWYRQPLLLGGAWAFTAVSGLPPAALMGLYGRDYLRTHVRQITLGLVAGLCAGMLPPATILRPHPPVRTLPAGCPALDTVEAVGQGGEDCYGLLGLHDDDAGYAFGRDEDADGALYWQKSILAANRQARPGEPTVIWVGELTCAHYDDNPAHCRSSGDVFNHDSEIDELKALRMAQATWHVRVVIGNAGEHDDYIDKLGARIAALDEADAFGARRVVIGGGNSKTRTRAAIENQFLRSGIPVIAPNLSADDTAPGRPFTARPGYLQLANPVDTQAQVIVDGLIKTFPKGVHLVVYRTDDANDLYTLSLKQDVTIRVNRLAAEPTRAKIDVDTVQPGGLGQRICQTNTGDGDWPTAVFFADRYFRYVSFVDEVERLCHGKPTLVLTDSSANKLLSNNWSTPLPADWPTFYFSAGRQCYDLDPALAGQLINAIARPRADGGLGTLCSPGGGQIGDHLAPFWDAVVLARQVLPDRKTAQDDLPSLHLPGTATSQAPLVTVVDGQIDTSRGRPIPVIGLCLAHLDTRGGRSARLCDTPLGSSRPHFFVLTVPS